MISVIGVMLTTASLIIVLSVFNGFEKLVISLFNSFNPELLVEPVQGKTFRLDAFPTEKLNPIDGVDKISYVLEESALLKYKGQQALVKLRGVDSSFVNMTRFDTLMVQGHFVLNEFKTNYLVLGYGVAYRLQSRLGDLSNSIQVFLPDKSTDAGARIDDSFRSTYLYPSGFFSVRQDYDENYAFISLDYLQQIVGLEQVISSVEISLKPKNDVGQVQREVQKAVGAEYKVKNRFEQQSVLLQVMQSEKLMVYIILGFILLIATFNIIGSISMLIVDKKPDIKTLKALGASKKLILNIFAIEGMMISLAGGLTGLVLGGFISWLQQEFGLISLGEGGTGFVVNSYPVSIMFSDFIQVLLMVLLMSAISVIYPLRQLARRLD